MSERGAGGEVGDEGLLDALARGSDDAFETVYAQFAPALLRAATGVAGSRATGEDAMQEAFVSLVKLGARVRGIRNLRAYLFTAVIRAARRQPRANTAALRLDVDLPAAALETAHTQPDSPEGSDRLERALQSLPLEQREVVTLHIDAGMTFDAVADALGISTNTASSRYRYALEKLRTALNAPSPASSEAASHG